jgi:hypothetical protein
LNDFLLFAGGAWLSLRALYQGLGVEGSLMFGVIDRFKLNKNESGKNYIEASE